MSKNQFQSNIKQFAKKVNSYIKIADTKSYGCIVIHEHLGLVENIVQTTQFLLGPKISIMIPDLFLSVTSKSLLNNQFDAIKKLKFIRVLQAVQVCITQLQKNHSKLMLIGYSIGSAYAFKVLQKLSNKFECAFLFYGTPNLQKFNPVNIKTKIVSFYGSDDKIKYLSDHNTYADFINLCKTNPLIKFQQINGVGHGFVNPESVNFSQKAILYCQKILFTYLPSNLITHPDAGKIQYENNDNKKDGCTIF